MQPATRPRLALIDDHHLVLDGLASWVNKNAPDLDLVIVVDSWSKLLHDPAFPPDVIVMDYQLAEPISIEARLGLCRAAGAVVVVMSAVDDPLTAERIMAAGAAAFVPKSRPAGDVIDAVRVALGGAALGPDSADGYAAASYDAASYDDDRFTPAEIEMLNLYADGNSPIEVALLLSTKPAAVKRALDRFRARYAREGRPAPDRESLIRRAAEDGYLA